MDDKNETVFNIKPGDLITLDLLYNVNNLSYKILKFTKSLEGLKIETMMDMLELRGILISDEVKKLISENFFTSKYDEVHHLIYQKVAIIKGTSAWSRSPEILMRGELPEKCYLVNTKVAFHVVYILSHFLTRAVLNIHNLNRIYIMSEGLVLCWGYYGHGLGRIDTALYDNPYSGDKHTGYLFFTIL